MDQIKNFAYSTVATAPSPATSGTSVVVTTGEGSRFPTPPFNAVIWATGSIPIPTNAEIVRVTAISTDTFTITRAHESSSARTVVVGDQIAAAITKKVIEDTFTWLTKTANYTAVRGEQIACDTSGGAFTITLPASPATGDFVKIKAGSSVNTNALTIARNSSTIMGLSENMDISTPNIEVTLVYNGTTWKV